jgi:putative flippase GtrA
MIPVKSRFAVLPKYFLVSCIGLTIDTALLLFLKSLLGVPYIIAGTLSFVAGSIVGYFLCAHYVFETPGRTPHVGLTLFVLLGGVGLGINAIVLAGAVELAHAPILIAKGASAICTFFVNYWLRRRWVFMPAAAA